jgi:hypothetical protein
MHILEAEAIARDWTVVDKGTMHRRRAALACGAFSGAALVAAATTLMLPYLATTILLAASLGIAMPVLVWYAQKNDAWIVARQGVAVSNGGRTWWLLWQDVANIIPASNLIDQYAKTTILKVITQDGKERPMPAMDANLATKILRHVEPAAE